ncbi:MAG: GTPase Era [Oscillospiraceae bacterium]|nr:GTPase Era [Oscillospiraceae bacterium]
MSKTLFAAIVGCPNVGKSSLLNRLLGQKIAIVSPKPQTTRTKIMGVLTSGGTQFVFTDTPGLHRPKSLLGESMVKAVGDGISGGDLAILVTEPTAKSDIDVLRPAEKDILEKCEKLKIPVILAINKIDTLESKALILERIQQLSPLFDFAAIIPVSALKSDGVDELLAELEKHTAESPHFFPGDAITDQPERLLAAEIIREKLLLHLQQELPHETAVLVEEWSEREDGLLSIGAAIFCGKSRHKGMILGKGGETLKKISSSARVDMENFFGCKVFLRCFVKSREGWQNSAGTLKELGY